MAKTAKKSTKKRKLAGNALKQKAYALIKKGAAKLVAAKGRGKSVNTRYSKSKSHKEAIGVYVYELKKRK